MKVIAPTNTAPIPAKACASQGATMLFVRWNTYPNSIPNPKVDITPLIEVIGSVDVGVPSNGGAKCHRVKQTEVTNSPVHFPNAY